MSYRILLVISSKGKGPAVCGSVFMQNETLHWQEIFGYISHGFNTYPSILRLLARHPYFGESIGNLVLVPPDRDFGARILRWRIYLGVNTKNHWYRNGEWDEEKERDTKRHDINQISPPGNWSWILVGISGSQCGNPFLRVIPPMRQRRYTIYTYISSH